MKRIFLFLATNLAVVIVLGIVMEVLGIRGILDAQGSGIIVNAARSVIYASDGADFAQAARREAEALRNAIEEHRMAAQAESRR